MGVLIEFLCCLEYSLIFDAQLYLCVFVWFSVTWITIFSYFSTFLFVAFGELEQRDDFFFSFRNFASSGFLWNLGIRLECVTNYGSGLPVYTSSALYLGFHKMPEFIWLNLNVCLMIYSYLSISFWFLFKVLLSEFSAAILRCGDTCLIADTCLTADTCLIVHTCLTDQSTWQ